MVGQSQLEGGIRNYIGRYTTTTVNPAYPIDTRNTHIFNAGSGCGARPGTIAGEILYWLFPDFRNGEGTYMFVADAG